MKKTEVLPVHPLVDKVLKNWKRYLVSSILTFLTGFAVAFIADADQITAETLQNGTGLGFVIIWVRAGLKLVFEGFIAFITKK